MFQQSSFNFIRFTQLSNPPKRSNKVFISILFSNSAMCSVLWNPFQRYFTVYKQMCFGTRHAVNREAKHANALSAGRNGQSLWMLNARFLPFKWVSFLRHYYLVWNAAVDPLRRLKLRVSRLVNPLDCQRYLIKLTSWWQWEHEKPLNTKRLTAVSSVLNLFLTQRDYH